jgi:hypothetical protein
MGFEIQESGLEKEVIIKKKIKLRGFSPQANLLTQAPPHVSVVNALRREGVAWSAHRNPTAVNLGSLDSEPLLSLSSSSSVILTSLSGPRSRPTTSQKIW